MKTHEKIPGWNDIVFQNRNKKYGAYELRTQYHRRLLKAFTITISGLILIFFFTFIKGNKQFSVNTITSNDSLIFSDVGIIEIIQKPEIRKPYHSSLQNPIFNSFIAQIDTTEPLKSDTVDESLKGASSGSFSGDSSTVLTSDTSIHTGPSENKPEVFGTSSVDKSPEFPGGMEKFYKFLKNRIRYTQEAIRARLALKVYIQFIVNEEGVVTDIQILNKAGYGLDEEIYNALISSPKWTPGTFSNKSVNTKLIVPVNFSLVQ